ncbi:Stf0 family sulfotransferase [Pleurocapsa sp. PCC 7319]|uniref:Stf0 family sulfotransferase n=1 Tax=Pleurocapsa sp. PCC 7319 TaxID=118161 RepID=UPI000345D285|nr:Stf0 family sulfotransferase [Pleurocapsa sp. PCC 7319]
MPFQSTQQTLDNVAVESKKVIICATQRCGSTLVCNDFLNNGIGRPEELFLGLVNSTCVSDSQRVLDNVIQTGTNESGVFSVKLMSNYCNKINNFLVALGYGKKSENFWSGIADYFSDATWVYIQRSSTIRQAVSRFMSSKTGINHALSSKSERFTPGNSMIGYDNNYNKNVQYCSEDINKHIINIARENFLWELFFKENNINYLKINYEDIVDNLSYISQIREAAELPYKIPINKRNLVKLANEKTEQIIQKFIRDKTMVANSKINLPHYLEDNNEIVETLTEVTKRWVDTPYYDNVENIATQQWKNIIHPFIKDFSIDYGNVLELAVGHGRITNILLEISEQVIGVDVLQENIDFCSERFQNCSNLKLLKNNGVTIKDIASNSISFIICFDSMIHFDSDVVRIYLHEFKRILKPGAYGFLHHSNFDKNPEGDFSRAPHARNFMTEKLFRHYAFKSGLKVVKSHVIGWGKGDKHFPEHDCLSMIMKPK